MRRAEAPELHAAKEFGGKLFRAVFTGELIAQLRGSVEQSLNNDRGLRIRLRLTDAPELADLPVRVAASRYRIGVSLAVCSIDGLTSSGGFAVTGYRPMTLADLAGRVVDPV